MYTSPTTQALLSTTTVIQRGVDLLHLCVSLLSAHGFVGAEFALYDVEEYMHSSNRWVNKAPLPEARFRFDTAHVVMGSNDRVLTFGGAPSCSGKRDSTKEDCVAVALDTVWGYFDEQYPDTYVAVKQP